MAEHSSGDYALEWSERERERLRTLVRTHAGTAREACLRAGLTPGSRVIDIGCGPIGAIETLAELVGPNGTVAGLDVSDSALGPARHIAAERGHHNVEFVQAGINSVGSASLEPYLPFDLAFCRNVLTHQSDPVATFGEIAALLRPGGRLVAQDPIHDSSYPRSEPPIPAVQRMFELLYATIRSTVLERDLATGPVLDALRDDLDAAEAVAPRVTVGSLVVVIISEVP